MPAPPPAGSAADRNLLFGVLALQLDFVSRDALIEAMHAWAMEKGKALGQILVQRQALRPDKQQLLEALVDAHLEEHGNRADQSLAAVRPPAPLRRQLESIADPDLQASLLFFSTGDFPPDQPPGEAPTADHTAVTPGVSLRYEVLRPHARGGLGEVFVALDPHLGREVALKEIHAGHADHPGHRARFVREAEVTGRLEHPGIVPVYALGHYPDGRPFYAMRFVGGQTLKDAIHDFHRSGGAGLSERNLAFRQLLGRFVAVCNAVAYAHSRGVLHRDLKPSNVLLGEFGETLVVDWGLARVLEQAHADSMSAGPGEDDATPEGLTRAGTVLGTPGYMSPEQAASRLEELGPASDVYGLGATLYTLLTGRPAFTGSDTGALLQRVLRGDFPRPGQVQHAVPRALEAVCLKAMALHPDDRYASPRALAEDIEHWLADEPVGAYSEPFVARARRWMRRHRALVTAAAAALLVGAVSLGAATLLLSGVNEDLRRANQRETQAREQEERSHRLALANFELANQAAEDYLFNVVEDPRLKERDLHELRKKLLSSAEVFYRKFAGERQGDPRLELLRGRAFFNLGVLQRELGESREGVEKLLQTQAIFKALAGRDPANPEHRYYLGLSGLELEFTYRQTLKRFDRAEEQLRAAQPLLQRLAREHPGVKKYRKAEALAVHLLGRHFADRALLDRAEEHHRRALDLQRRIARDFPGPEEQHHLTISLGNVGFVLRRSNRQQEARKYLEEGIRINRTLVRTARRHPSYREMTVALHSNLARVLLDLGERTEAVNALHTNVEGCQQLVADFPTVPSYRHDLVDSLQSLVGELTNAGETAQAVRLGRQAVREGEKLVGEFRREARFREVLGHACRELARALHRAGEVAEGESYRRRSVEIWAKLCKDYPEIPANREHLGTSLSGLAFVLEKTNRRKEAKDEGLKAVAVFEKLAGDYPRVAEYRYRVAEACVGLARTLEALGEPSREVARKGLAAIEPLLEKDKNTRYQQVRTFLRLHLSRQP
jgi:serine/threonine-protein kinase